MQTHISPSHIFKHKLEDNRKHDKSAVVPKYINAMYYCAYEDGEVAIGRDGSILSNKSRLCIKDAPMMNTDTVSEDSDFSLENTINAKIPGVSPQLQGAYNCIVAALGNVLWYKASNGYPAFTGNGSISFNTLKSRIKTIMLNYQGYTNNSVPVAASRYCLYYAPNYEIP